MFLVELQVTTQVKSCCITIYKGKVVSKVFCSFNWYKSHQIFTQKFHSDILQFNCFENILNSCNFCMFRRLLPSLLKTYSPNTTMKGGYKALRAIYTPISDTFAKD